MKSDFQRVKDEVSSIVKREREAEASAKQQEENCRHQYESAQQEMCAALDRGDKDQYKTAGMRAEEARLELEFYEKSRSAGRKPAATPDVDRRIVAVLTAETKQIKIDTLSKLKAIFSEAASVCNESQNHLNEINNLFVDWKKVVMKEDCGNTTPTRESAVTIASFFSTINAQLYRFTMMGRLPDQ